LGGAGHRGVGGSAEGPLAAPIMASALMILFLGCWLAGQSGVSGYAGSIPGGGTDPTQPETTSTPTHSGSVGPSIKSGDKKSPSSPPETGGPEQNLNIPIIAGVSAAAAGLLLLLLAFVCYRRTRGRKGPAPRQSRESEAASTVYALLGEGKQLDVLPQKPDTGAEGHTYAELGCQELQAKQGESAPAPEPVLYATIDVSQVPDGQSPQGAGAPPTHSP
ncbi:hypothetical protein G0U57_013091, partial [Chelydra serpentina]